MTGIDLADRMLDVARAKLRPGVANPTFRSGDAVASAFEPETFDAITSRMVLWTLRGAADAVANWRTLLRPGGRVAAVDGDWFGGSLAEHLDELENSHPGSFVDAYREVTGELALSST